MLLGVLGGFAQQNLPTEFRLTGKTLLSSLEEQRVAIQKISAVFLEGRKQLGYGIVVRPDGYILAKQSEIAKGDMGKLQVRIDRKVYKDVEFVSTDFEWDVGLYKVEAEGLAVPEFAADSEAKRGSVVIVNGATSRTKRRILAGIVSAKAREITPDGGAVLGVQLDGDKEGLTIGSVTDESGAEGAGLKKGDLIQELDGQIVTDLEDMSEILKEMKAGQEVEVLLLREGEEVREMVRLAARGELFEEVDRNDQMSGDFSKRRSGFPRVMQHDIMGNSATMGGPVINLDGKLVGMNIARANRAETFAIPVKEFRKITTRMIEEAVRADD